MPHICMDEILLFFGIFPFVGVAFRRAHAWFHTKTKHKGHDD